MTAGSETKTGDHSIVEVRDWQPVRDAYRCPALHVTSGEGETYAPYFDRGTVIAIDGKPHTQRRRFLGQLLTSTEWFKDNVLIPTVERNLREALADGQGPAHVDLMRFNMRAAQQLSAAMVGLDRAATTAGVAELLELGQALAKSEAKFEMLHGFDERLLPGVLAARQAIYEDFYRPALRRRRELVDRHRAGELERSELPQDLITLTLLCPAGAPDEGTAFREVLLMLTAGTMTTALTTTWSIHELLEWLDSHPEDRSRIPDPAFLLGAFNEALRLHPGFAANVRRAGEDVTLEDGPTVHRDQYVLLHKQLANRDPRVFGDDADVFNPRRVLPAGVNAYGLSFGHGTHKCYGMPLVIGNQSTDGVAVLLLSRLFAAGIRRDGERQPEKVVTEHAAYDQWRTYPVILGPSETEQS